MSTDQRSRSCYRKKVSSNKLFLLMVLVWGLTVVEGKRDDKSSTAEPPVTSVPLKFDPDYRELQWCVNGYDEPEFRRYPLNEFQPFLQRKHFTPRDANTRFRYRVELRPIQVDLDLEGVDSVGAGGYLYQRAHFVFKVQLREVFYHDIALRWRETKIEGLIVQANFGPHGVGLPVGQFDHPKYFSCIDCAKPLGIPVACRRRTHMHIAHPTVMVYHHKMKPVREHRERQFKNCDEADVKKQCVLTGVLREEEPTEKSKNISTTTCPPSGSCDQSNTTDTAIPVPIIWNNTIDPSEYNKVLFNTELEDPYCKEDADCDAKLKEWFAKACCQNDMAEVPDDYMDLCITNQHIWGIEQMLKRPCPPAKSDGILSTPPPNDMCMNRDEQLMDGTTTGGERGATGSGSSWSGAPPVDPMKHKKPCPNAGGMDATMNATDSLNFLLDPSEMSVDWPQFKCQPVVVTVCREPDAKRNVDFPEAYAIDHQTMMPYMAPPASGPNAQPPFNPFDLDSQCCLGSIPGAPPCPDMDREGQPQPTRSCKKADPTGNPPIMSTSCVKRFLQPVKWELGMRETWQFQGDYNPPDCSQHLPPPEGEPDEYGPTNETHANFVWYVPPCRQDPIPVKFQLLVVHDFHRAIYSILEHDEIFHLKRNPASNDDNFYIPTPAFTGFKHKCDKQVALAEYIYSKTTDKTFRISHSKGYDKCVQNRTGPHLVHEQRCPGVPEFRPPRQSGKVTKKRPPKPDTDTSQYKLFPKCDINTFLENILPCDNVCPKLELSTSEVIETPTKGFFKRTGHGAINIVTNFCIMPICVFIARFYKETYNQHSYKGQKLWYWMHMIGSMVSTVLMYMGYFTEKLVKHEGTDPHHICGAVYIFFLAMSYVTSWMRHKKRWISMIVEIMHSIGGYTSIFLAAGCVYNAKNDGEPINDAVKYVCYAAVLILVVFYVGMTVHICDLDRRFGMKPRRWHFPSVEAKFDDLPVPGAPIRKMLLYILLFINLPLTLATMFI